MWCGICFPPMWRVSPPREQYSGGVPSGGLPDCTRLRADLAGDATAAGGGQRGGLPEKVKRRGRRRGGGSSRHGAGFHGWGSRPSCSSSGRLPTGTTGRISTGRLTQMCRGSWICISIPNGLILPTVTGWWKTKTASFVSARGRSCRHSFMMPPTIGSIFRWMVCGKFGWPIN